MNTKIKLAENFVKSFFELLDEHTKGEPLEKPLADQLIANAAYIKLGPAFNKLHNVQIYLPDFLQWCWDTTGGTGCLGIRVYFAVPPANDFISFIIAAIGTDGKEKGYYFLANYTYIQGDLKATGNLPRGRDEAIEYITRYAQLVFLVDHPFQKNYPQDKICRKYIFNDDLVKLCSDNIDDSPYPFNGYYLFMTHGYVSISQSPTLCSRSSGACGGDPTTMLGHTSLICICTNVPPVLKINPAATYDPAHPKDYKGKYLEIGNPCPPDCGDIKKTDLPLP